MELETRELQTNSEVGTAQEEKALFMECKSVKS